MGKAVLSNRIYMSYDRDLLTKLERELTYKIPSPLPMEPPIVIRNLTIVSSKILSIPIGRTDLIPEDYEIVDKRNQVLVDFPDFKATLRESQQEVLDSVNDNCMINAPVSWGKTFTALAIVEKLGQKTLVITGDTALRRQWEIQIEKLFGFSPGVLGSGSFDMGPIIQVGNIQTLYRQTSKLTNSFGLIILDECHHVSANTFGRLIDTNRARYKIGLSGTLERKDGKHVIFPDYFSTDIKRPKAENYMQPEVHIVKTGIKFASDGSRPWASRINDLLYSDVYLDLVVALANHYERKGHKVLIVSDRVDFLKTGAELVGDSAICITGSVPIEEREDIQNQVYGDKVNQLWGTLSIYKEGISVDCLSCLIIATMLNNDPMLEQLIGRIKRVYPNKQTPIVVDMHLEGTTAQRQASARMGHYIKEGYYITQV